MTKTFAVLVSGFCFLLGACSLWVNAGDCMAALRVSVVTVLMVSLGQYLLNLANENPIGAWLTFYRAGWVLSGVLIFSTLNRVISSFQVQSCSL